MSWVSRIGNLFRRSEVDREIDEELQFHLDERVEELIRQGLTREEARRQARLRFGSPVVTREAGHDLKVSARLESVLRDARFAVRLMVKAPLFTIAIVFSLALAIGANTAVFSLLDAVVLRPLPVREPDRLVFLSFPGDGSNPLAREVDYFNYPLFRTLRDAGRPVVDLFGMAYQVPRRVVFGGDIERAEKLYAQWVSGDALSLLGVQAALGRSLTADDDRIPGAHPVAVISYSLWDRQFGRDPGVLGRRVRIQGPEDHSYEIVGVLAKGFTGAEPGILTDIWLPNMMWSGRAIEDARSSWFRIWGRLKPGATPENVKAALQPSFSAFRRDRMAEFRSSEPADRVKRYLGARLNAHPAANGPSLLRKTYERFLWILMGVVGLLLLGACANVGNLLLARAAAREREMALRISIGAGRGRLIQQVLIECGLLSVAAAALGCVFALIFAPLVVRMLDTQLYPVGVPIALDLRTLSALLMFGIVTTFLFGTIPALRVSAIDPHEFMKQSGGRLAAHAGTSRWLLGAQVCCGFVILFMAGLFLTSFRKLSMESLGFRSDGLYLISVDASKAPTGESGRAAWQQLRERAREIPGVTSASAAGFGLFSGQGWLQNIRVPGRTADSVQANLVAVAPGYFETIGISLRAGRDLTERDLDEGVPGPAIVNEAFIKRYFDGILPVGRRFEKVDIRGTAETLSIIGVAADAKYDSVRNPSPPTVYLPFRGGDQGTVLIRSKLELAALATLLRDELPRVHPAFRLIEIRSQARLVSDSLARDRGLALLSTLLAALAVMLAGLGLYAVLSYGVARRTKEIGIRLALGATRPGVVRLVLRDAIAVAAIGVTAGLAVGAGLSRFVTSLLFETHPLDASSLALPVACLALATVLSSAPAALRVVSIDPSESLRHE